MYKYEYLKGKKDKLGIQWEFKGFAYQDKNLIEVLNILGGNDWKLVSKEDNIKYILMKKCE